MDAYYEVKSKAMEYISSKLYFFNDIEIYGLHVPPSIVYTLQTNHLITG